MIYAPLDEIVRLIGEQAALHLVEAFSGTRIYLPHPSRVNPDGPVARALGLEAAIRLSSEWPQCEIEIPKSDKLLRRERDRRIKAEPATMLIRDIARKYGLTERQVYRIRASADPDAPDAPATPAAGSLP